MSDEQKQAPHPADTVMGRGTVECTCCPMCRQQIVLLIGELREVKKERDAAKKTSLAHFNKTHEQNQTIADLHEEYRALVGRIEGFVRGVVKDGIVGVEIRIGDDPDDDY